MPGDADDEDGNRSLPVPGPRSRGTHVPVQIWSSDEATGVKVGFMCSRDITKGIFYAKLELGAISELEPEALAPEGALSDRSTKGAITTLLDVAEACGSRKITMGLGAEHAACAEFICSLLYLGFQVVPSRKSPLGHSALLLDLDIGYPAPGGMSSSEVLTDHTFTGTSDCSTSAQEDNGLPDSDFHDSE